MATPITIRKAAGNWTVRAGGAVIAESTDALELVEGDYPARIYFPRDDIAMAFLDQSDLVSACKDKGDATYFSVVTKSRTLANTAWSYETPNPVATRLAGHISFEVSEWVAVERI